MRRVEQTILCWFADPRSQAWFKELFPVSRLGLLCVLTFQVMSCHVRNASPAPSPPSPSASRACPTAANRTQMTADAGVTIAHAHPTHPHSSILIHEIGARSAAARRPGGPTVRSAAPPPFLLPTGKARARGGAVGAQNFDGAVKPAAPSRSSQLALPPVRIPRPPSPHPPPALSFSLSHPPPPPLCLALALLPLPHLSPFSP